jgi:hypothetical protein
VTMSLQPRILTPADAGRLGPASPHKASLARSRPPSWLISVLGHPLPVGGAIQ